MRSEISAEIRWMRSRVGDGAWQTADAAPDRTRHAAAKSLRSPLLRCLFRYPRLFITLHLSTASLPYFIQSFFSGAFYQTGFAGLTVHLFKAACSYWSLGVVFAGIDSGGNILHKSICPSATCVPDVYIYNIHNFSPNLNGQSTNV